MSDRIAPYDEQVERAVLGSMLVGGGPTWMEVNGLGVGPEAWYIPALRMIATVVWELGGKDPERIDLLMVMAELRNIGRMEAVGGDLYVEGLVADVTTVSHVGYYAKILRDKWWLRKVIVAGESLSQEAQTRTDGIEEFVTAAPERLMNIVHLPETEVNNGEVMNRIIVKWEDALAFRNGDLSKRPAIGYETPYEALTEMMCGLEQGLTIIAGRPSSGKTTLEDVISEHVARNGIPVLRVTMDSSRQSLLGRALCRNAGVSMPKCKFGFARRDQLARMRDEKKRLEKLPVRIRTDLRDVAAIRMAAIEGKRKWGMGMLTVDYVQQVQTAELGWAAGNELARVTHAVGQLKALAMMLDIPVIVLSQLSRAGEKDGRTDPMMSDLRSSGALEQDADKILFVGIDAKKRKEMEERQPGATKHKRPVWFWLSKQKDGESGRMPMWLLAPYFQFSPAQDDFADDTLPGDVGELQKEFGVYPETEPAEEGAG